MSRPKRVITDLEKEKICQDYKNCKSLRQLQKQTKLQRPKIKEILKENKITILSAYETQTKNGSAEKRNYFDELNPLQCYVLGVIFGDGCVHYNPTKYKYALTITSNDLDILESSQKLFGNQFLIKKRKVSNAYNLVINSKHICEELINKFHLQSPKSEKLIFPILPKENYSYFISGLLSTDGCIRIDKRYSTKTALNFEYSSNCLEFVISLRQFLSNVIDTPKEGCIKKNTTNRKNTNYCLRFSGSNAIKILHFIYNEKTDDTICKRKYNLYQNFLKKLKSQTQ